MTIRNNDGTPWKPAGVLNLSDPNDTAHELFNLFDSESIMIGGIQIYYFEVFIQLQTVDRLYLEDRGKLWSPNPIQLYCFYEPPEQQTPSTAFGLDAPDEVIIELNYQAFLQAVGHPPKRGSRIYTPHRGENWVIIDTRLTEFKFWGALRLQLICQKWSESTTTSENTTNKDLPNYTIY